MNSRQSAAVSATLHTGLSLLERTRAPRTRGVFRVRGLRARVEVVRDRWGVPHIYAEDTLDVLFAQGYLHAQERLWQMDFQRRAAAGRLAEVLGPIVVPADRWTRILGLRRAAEADYALLTDVERAELVAYAAGVNARIAHGPRPAECTLLRYRPEPWRPVDSLAWSKMVAWGLSVNWETELLRAALVERLGPEEAAALEPPPLPRWPTIIPSDRTAAGNVDGRADSMPETGPFGLGALDAAAAALPHLPLPPVPGVGSNSWVISGSRTTSGKPLLANDMHLPISAPAIWFENHLIAEREGLDVTGVSFPGIPRVIAGHNGRVAWGFTNGFADVQDLFQERLTRSDDGTVRYEHRCEWHDAEVRQEVIQVRGGQPIDQEVIVTRHGPIINALAADLAGEVPLALNWTSLQGETPYRSLRALNAARTCAGVRKALRDWTSPVQNCVYADTAGEIGYTLAGRVPVREKGDGRLPVPGWSGDYDWAGFLRHDELPQLANPPQGYVVTANNRIAGAEYSHTLGRDFAVGDRAQRIVELIESLAGATVADMKTIQYDQVSPSARLFPGQLRTLRPAGPREAAALDLLAAWDGRMTPNSTAPAIYSVWTRLIVKVMLEERLGDLLERYMGKGPTPLLQEFSMFSHRAWEWLCRQLELEEPVDRNDGGPDSRAEKLGGALRRTLAHLEDQLGAPGGDDMPAWRWGNLHQLTFAHILGREPSLARHFSRGPFPVGGDLNTVWATGAGMTPAAPGAVVGPPFRFIADLSDLRNSVAILAPGNSGVPADRHYDDQVAAWFGGGYRPMAYARLDVWRDAESAMVLRPVAHVD